jgi:hypothetical protein
MAGYTEVNRSVQPKVNPLTDCQKIGSSLTLAVYISIVNIEGIHLLSLLPITLLDKRLITLGVGSG